MRLKARKQLASARAGDWRDPIYRSRMIKKLKAAWKRGRDKRTKYGDLGLLHRKELAHFSGMHDRVKVWQAPGINGSEVEKTLLRFLKPSGRSRAE